MEWVGEGFGLPEGVVGSSRHGSGDEIGTGASLGVPCMVATRSAVPGEQGFETEAGRAGNPL